MVENPIVKSQNLTKSSTDNLTVALNSTEIPPEPSILRSLFMELIRYNDHALTIYSILVILSIVITVTRSLGFFRYCMRASTNLHNNMFHKIVFSPMLFFNNNPSGRILNRFSKDIGNVDEVLPITMIDTVQVGYL